MVEKIFNKYLKEKKLIFTKERKAILDEVLTYKKHFDSEELFIRMHKKSSKVSRASVYRTLSLLLESGIIERVENIEKQSKYELKIGKKHHDHMLCLSCGKIIEFYSDDLEKLQDEICLKEGFESKNHKLEILGYCRDCRRN